MLHPMPDDAEVLAFLEKSDLFYPADAVNFSAEEQRDWYDRLCVEFRQTRPEHVLVVDDVIEAEGPDRPLPVRLYQNTKGGRHDQVLLYLHGGGFVVGSIESHDDVCADLCGRTGLSVLAVDYRLAPEDLYPSQLDDVEAVYNYARQRYEAVLVGGDSAGGGLTAALCVRCFNKEMRMPEGQLHIYPGFGGDMTAPSYEENRDAPMLTTEDCGYYFSLYAGGAYDAVRTDPEFAPLYQPDFAIFPRAAIFTADIDPLRDDGKQFAEKLQAVGVDCQYRNDSQLVHSYLRARTMSERASDAFSAICSALVWLSDKAIADREAIEAEQ